MRDTTLKLSITVVLMKAHSNNAFCCLPTVTFKKEPPVKNKSNGRRKGGQTDFFLVISSFACECFQRRQTREAHIF